jgi:ferredoxin
VPYLLAVDGKDVLQRLVIDDKLVQAARRCLENWHRLQEFGGVHSSHAQRLLARERAAWEEEKRKEIEALRAAQPADAEPEAAGAAAAPAAAAAPVAEAAAEVEPERSPDEAYIETIRCSSCNECTNINDKMFAYNENKQAYIKDIKAGTYRQMVEAAESCQLSIIHPGKPIDPKEPGLEELIERAKPFM